MGLRHLSRGLVAVSLPVLIGAGCVPDGASDDAGAPDVPRVSCEMPVGGIPLSETVLESTPGFDEAFAAVDFSQLPATLDLSGLPTDDRGAIAYALGQRLEELGDSLDVAALMERGEMGRAVLAAWAASDPTGAAGFDRDFFRRGFHRFYACDRQFPVTLDGFEALYGPIEDLELLSVDFSIPKGVPRALYEDRERHIYAARTTLEDGAVRETEILLGDHRPDGQLDFLVYDEDGALMDRSQFFTVTGGQVVSASPYSCMSCHVNFETRAYDVVFPTGQ